MEVNHKEKVDLFYKAMEERGYKVELRNESVDPFIYELLEHVVTKEDYYHVAIKEYLIIDAPLDYLIDLVEGEFELLKD